MGEQTPTLGQEMNARQSKRLSDDDLTTCLFGGFGISTAGLVILFVSTLSFAFSLVLSGILVASFGLMFGYLQKGFPAAWYGLVSSSIGGVCGFAVSFFLYSIPTL